MALLDLPNELLLQIITHIFLGQPTTYHRPSPSERRNFSSVLRVSRLLHSLALPLFYQHVTMGVPGLCKLPAAQSTGLASSVEVSIPDPMAAHMRSLDVELEYFSSPVHSFGFSIATYNSAGSSTSTDLDASREQAGELKRMAETKVPVLVPPKQAAYLGFETWFALLNTRLAAFSTHWPLCTRLTHLRICAQQLDRTTDIFTRARRATRPFLDEATLLQCFGAIARCKQLKVLELDTADADASRWSLDTGVGPACAMHVCEALRTAIEALPRLRRLYVRRRDVCPRAVAFQAESAVLQSGLLEEVVVDLRMADTQRTGREIWEAHARHCACCCWCTKCLKRWREGKSENEEDGDARGLVQEQEMHVGHRRVEDGGGLLVDMMVKQLGRLASDMTAGNATRMEIRAYEVPATEMLGRGRKPVVIDCLTGKRTEACGVL